MSFIFEKMCTVLILIVGIERRS